MTLNSNGNIVHTLIQKRAGITADMAKAREQMQQWVRDIEGIDTTLRLFSPGYKGDGVKARAAPAEKWVGNYGLVNMLLDTLRTAGKPMTTRELAISLLVAKGGAEPDSALIYRTIFADLLTSGGNIIMM